MNKQPSQPDAIELLPGMACTKADLMKRIRDQLRVPVIAGADQRMERIDGRHGKRRHRRVDLGVSTFGNGKTAANRKPVPGRRRAGNESQEKGCSVRRMEKRWRAFRCGKMKTVSRKRGECSLWRGSSSETNCFFLTCWSW